MPNNRPILFDKTDESTRPGSAPDTVPPQPTPLWARWLLPSLPDVFFIAVTYVLGFSPIAANLLNDADTGWHIRNGEHILRTLSVPHADYFSYTMTGRPWYAWEWLYDVIIGAIHRQAGLNGVVLFTALVIASTFALLFRLVLLRRGSFVYSLLAAMLALLSTQVHILARPHVLSWLMTVVWLWVLLSYQDGKRRRLLLLPPLMLFWVNVHGGFLIGLVLVGIFAIANLWTYIVGADEGEKAPAKSRASALTVTGLATLLATFATPYGYKLHLHVAAYLSNRYLMDHIDEFRSPNFHSVAAMWFVVLLLIVVAAGVLKPKRASVLEVLLVVFSIVSALQAARNIPIAAILLSIVAAGWLAAAVDSYLEGAVGSGRFRATLSSLREFSSGMDRLQLQLRGHLLPLLVVVIAIAIAVNGGRVGRLHVLAAHFDETKFPVRAAAFIAERGIRDHMFNADDWSGYLIYRLPQNRVYFDDRHDFYGEAFIRDFITVTGVQYGWRDVLERYDVRWILLPADASITNALKETPDWKTIYDDGRAIIFARVAPSSIENGQNSTK